MSESIAAVVVGALTLAGGVIAAWLNSRSAEKKSVSEQYQALVDDIQSFAEKKAMEQDRKIEWLSKRVQELETIAGKYDVALAHIRRVHASDTSGVLPPVPERLVDDVRLL